ncbi:hypothetical protein RhiirA4_481545 [Rhizophagus irregularis]|uniref:Uncharacterized protein n=1 Tax=Rhizophagus irregularis TaxID=588596 RepID=A0A2I1HJL9_9GLOM|nr:hypothetical protein RhiirA4_481545 [Rhizophagus irregularis]
MESYLRQDEFDEKLLKEVNALLRKNFKNAETCPSEKLQDGLDKIFFRTLRTHKVLTEISETTGIRGEIVEILLRGCLRYVYREYDNDVKRIGEQNTRLRSWLRQAQQKNQPHEGEPKRVNFSESEEPIKIQKRQREKSKKKERGKKEIKEIALPAPVDLQPIIKNSRGISATSRDIMFYNIPARFSESEVISAIKNLGNVHRIRIKKHYKYQSVRAEMNLFDDYENEFVKDIWKVQLLIGKSDKTQSAMQVRWFPGQSTVKSIKEKCKWKAYKIIRSSYYQDVARKNYSFEYGKMARFGKNLVFLAYFKDKDQLDAARALDKDANDETWIVHGKGWANTSEKNTKRTPRDLVSTIPKNDGKETIATKEQQSVVTTTIMDNVNTDEVVDVVNKFRKNLLDEIPQNRASTSIKDYASPEKVVEVVLDLREEINKELSQEEKDDETWVEKCRNGYAALLTDIKEIVKVKKSLDEVKAEYNAVAKKVDENQTLLDEIKIIKESEVEIQRSMRQVTPIELHEYESINESCKSRLPQKNKYAHLSEREAAQRSKYEALVDEARRKRGLKKQGDRVKEEEGIESDSDEESDVDVDVSTTSLNKRGGKPGSRGRGRGGRRRLVGKKQK